MIAQNTDLHEVVAPSDLKPLAEANGPCLTAVVTLPNPAQIGIQIKQAIRALEKALAEQETDAKTVSHLLKPIHDLAVETTTDGVWAHALILFRSPGLFRYYWLHGKFKDVQAVGDRFHVLPLLRTLAHETRFHVLALSQSDVRLFHGTQHRLELAATPGLPDNFEVWLNNRQPDHVRENWSTGGPSNGGMRGVISGTSTEREGKDENLHHFFKEIDKRVIQHLRGETGPLVLAGVDYELAMYRRVNSFHPTLDKAVSGSPDGVPEHTLHERTMEVVAGTFSDVLQRDLWNLREFLGTARASSEPRTVVQAAFQGRVSDLVIAANAEYWGAWNKEKQEVEADGREELLNAAALETILHRGRVFVLDAEDMPVKAPAAAVFRY
jgi:hypothetical protein